MVVGTGRARDLPAIIDELVKLSAAEGNKEVAEVRSAVDLTDDQKQRLAAALEAKPPARRSSSRSSSTRPCSAASSPRWATR